MSAPISLVKWKQSHRLVLSKYPPIDLFDDLSSPEDWEYLAQAESRTNPRIYDTIGDLSLVPPKRRVSGNGASWLMAPFTHISRERRSRFSDGSYGVYYCAHSLETAIRETTYHQERFLRATQEEAGWVLQMRELIAKVSHEFTDLREGTYSELLNPDDYGAAQGFAHSCRNGGGDGIIYPSQRHEGGECLAAFWPDVIGLPKQGSHWQYHWNGQRIDYVKKLSIGEERSLPFKL